MDVDKPTTLIKILCQETQGDIKNDMSLGYQILPNVCAAYITSDHIQGYRNNTTFFPQWLLDCHIGNFCQWSFLFLLVSG